MKHSGAKYKIGFDGDYVNISETTKKDNDKFYSLLIKTNVRREFEFFIEIKNFSENYLAL